MATTPKKPKAALRPLSKAGLEQLALELGDSEREQAAAKANTDPGSITITIRGWRRGLTIEIPPDD
jgi:hypothetical protein